MTIYREVVWEYISLLTICHMSSRKRFHQIIVDDRVGRYEAGETSRAVRELRRDGYARNRASAQLRHALVKPWDDLANP